MTSPLPLPDWVPWWVHLAALLAVLLAGLLLLLMPFSVFGVKGRLESIDARLDEIQGEIRSLAMRLPEDAAGDEDGGPPPRGTRPPIPPAPHFAEPQRARLPASRRGTQPDRTEPRLY